jgi:UDP-glucose 4-epimerase
MSNVLVTGGCGFLGSHIVDELLKKDYDVCVIDKKILKHSNSNKVEYIKFDLFKDDIPNEIVDQCDIIIHLAAFSDLNAALDAPIETVLNNVVATVKLLNLAVESKIDHFLFASTVYVYSQGGGFYKASKQACEVYIEEFQKRYGLDYTILRYGSLYGLRSDKNNGIHRLVKSALNDNKIVYDGTPDEKREYINVQDAARLTIETISSKYKNENYVITGQQRITNSDLITMFSEILNKELVVEYNNKSDISGSHYRITPYTYLPKPGKKITPRVSIDMGQGIIQLIEEIQNRGKQ